MTRAFPFYLAVMLAWISPHAIAAADPVQPPPAATVWMAESELSGTFGGKTIQGHYASGAQFTEIYRADGGIEYRERSRQYAGHWSVQAGTFCTIYQSDPTGGCYRVRQVSENCYEFYYVARTEFDAANDVTIRPSWTARAAVADRPATCDERPAV
jgi:hypothetical protein